ncbi:hypothetical protein I546_6641 [Mycobacterium kansasii 732]|nr:hypothetical protein I546_6641 [Mycobacterium kansasii 732]
MPPGVLGLEGVRPHRFGEAIALIFVGDDGAQAHHDIHLMDADAKPPPATRPLDNLRPWDV